MKTRPIVSVLFVVGVGIGPTFAQNIASRPGVVNRDVERYTLLPGPGLLSPARGAPQSGSFIWIAPAGSNVPTYRAGPALLKWSDESLTPGPASTGTLTLGSSNGSEEKIRVPATPKTVNPDSLRFEAKFSPVTPPLKKPAVPARK